MVLFVSYPPELKHQEDVLSSHSENPSVRMDFLMVYFCIMKPIIFSFLYLITVLALSKFVFEPTYLYYELPWLDIPMHIMGGFGVAVLASSILSYKKQKLSFVKVLVAYLVVAVLWELYEYTHDFMSVGAWQGTTLDTLSDIFNGFVGMVAAYFLVRK